jgi:hypothetical protein
MTEQPLGIASVKSEHESEPATGKATMSWGSIL